MNWLIWRIVTAKVATLSEIMHFWDLNDLYDAHEALDLQSEADEHYRKEYEKQQQLKQKK